MISKIRLVPIPKTVVERTILEPHIDANNVERVAQEKNTNERAIVRIRIPTKQVTHHEEHVDEHGHLQKVAHT